MNVNLPVPVAVDAAARPQRRTFPPVVPVVMASLICVVTAGILLASYVPRKPPLTIPIILLVVSAILLLAAVGIMIQIPRFAWAKFFLVAKWALLAYVITSGPLRPVRFSMSARLRESAMRSVRQVCVSSSSLPPGGS